MENLLLQLPHSTNQNTKRIKRPQSESTINDLPDEILSHILSFLPTKHAFKTILLSKKWIPICHSLSVLRIDDDGAVSNSMNRIHLLKLVEAFMFSPHSQHLPLKSFILNCRSQQWDAETDRFTFDKCLEAAKLRRVIYLYLYLLYIPLSPTIFCFKTLVSMTLIKIRPHTLFHSSVDLPLLKTLYMYDVCFHHIADFMKLLSGCPVLEKLSTVFVQANDRSATKVYFKPLSKLITADILLFEIPFKVLGHSRNDKKTDSFYKEFPVFENLTVLNLCWSTSAQIHEWDEVVKMLQSCPKLQSLSISKAKSSPTKEDWKYPYHVPQCLSSHLTTINITEYEAIEADFRFAAYILENARHLEKMTICRNHFPKPMESPHFLSDLFSCSRISPACKLSFSELYRFQYSYREPLVLNRLVLKFALILE
ncbi:putative FBD-associated F-box protein At3g50710 [Vicia villosa]|uniref:putative FBD-associated F-box protein At3g50710 n=1 Tax=Vicia villosa TaxID=3911 RepID=UPI00273BA74B|nr:putative FBD-associated F-box protein At3g50710 [Vicia villosa]